MNNVQVKVKKLHPDAVIPKYSYVNDAGFDLVAVEDVIIAPGETKKVPIGLAFAIPPGYELQIRPRSGISRKTKLRVSNAPGTVDAGYRGEVCVLVDNIASIELTLDNDCDIDGELLGYVLATEMYHTAKTVDGKQISIRELAIPDAVPEETYIIRKGDRIAQGVIAPVYQAQFEMVDELDETERGTGGFGSTGV
jgi:dUTP pyrophosphatase